MAEAPGQRSYFENLPKDLQREIFPGISLSAAARLAAVSKTFNNIINDANNPVIWIKMAKKLNIPVSKNPKEDVLAYYKSGNEQLLQYFANNGHNIPRVLDVFLQRKMIEDYVKTNLIGTEILKQAGGLGLEHDDPRWKDPEFQRNITPVLKFLIEIGAPIDRKIVLRILLTGNMETAKLLIEAKNPSALSQGMLSELIYKHGTFDIIKLLVDAKVPIQPDPITYAFNREDYNEICDFLEEAIKKQNE